MEALLGLDPDGDPDLVLKLMNEKQASGEGAIEELAAAGRDDALQVLHDLRDRLLAPQGTMEVQAIEKIRFASRAETLPADLLPWRLAKSAASEVRQVMGEKSGALSNKALSDFLGLPIEIFTMPPENSRPLFAVGALYGKEHNRIRIVLRSPYETSRRFEAIRILGDYILAPKEDRLWPATKAKTFRQKFQRAFAQEVLCPWESLQAELGSAVPDEEFIASAADRYSVSPLLVETLLVNKNRLSRDVVDFH
jgi:hypothetical protein